MTRAYPPDVLVFVGLGMLVVIPVTVVEPVVPVGTPPAGLPGVVLGEFELMQSWDPDKTLQEALPAVPTPRLSPPVIINVVSARSGGIHVKP